MSHCPPLEQLEQLLDEQLPDRQQRDCALHVSSCASCQGMLERLTADTEMNSGQGTVLLSRSRSAPAAKEPLSSATCLSNLG